MSDTTIHQTVVGGGDTIVEEDLLVEDVSIDGMCGAY
jgi:mycofactocin precursor